MGCTSGYLVPYLNALIKSINYYKTCKMSEYIRIALIYKLKHAGTYNALINNPSTRS